MRVSSIGFSLSGIPDNETVVVVTHGIVKKTQKTPAKEIAKAERIMREYFEDKRGKI